MSKLKKHVHWVEEKYWETDRVIDQKMERSMFPLAIVRMEVVLRSSVPIKIINV